MVSSMDRGKNGNEPMATVNFIGENSHATIPLDKVAHFREKFDDYSVTKKRGLIEAIKIAEDIEKGVTTYKGEVLPAILCWLEEKERISRKEKQRVTSVEKKPAKKPKRAADTKSEPVEEAPGPKAKKEEEKKGGDAAMDTEGNNSCRSKKRAQSEDSPVPEGKETLLQKEQDLIKKLAKGKNSKAILGKQKRVSECLKTIEEENLTTELLHDSRLGVDLQQFANVCMRTASLAPLLKSAQDVLKKMKRIVLTSYFGEEEEPHEPEVEKMEEVKSVAEDANVIVNATCNVPQQEIPAAAATAEPESKKPEEADKPKDPEPEIAAPAAVPSPIPAEKTEPEPRKELEPMVLGAPKEPALTVIVCQELADLLEEVRRAGVMQ